MDNRVSSAPDVPIGLTPRQQAIAVHGAALLLLILLSIALVSIYVTQEQFFYYWDSAYYHDETVRQAAVYRQQSFHAGWVSLRESMKSDYPFTYCQPLVPMLLLFGSSRLAYELGLALAYQVPYLLAMGAIASHLIPGSRRAVFWGSIAVFFFTPILWVPMLNGYPDVGAAMFLALAVWLYLGDMRLGRWQRIVAMGVCMGMLPLVRRHFAYDFLAFFTAIALHAMARFAWQLWGRLPICPTAGTGKMPVAPAASPTQDSIGPRQAFRDLLFQGLRIALVGLVSLAVLGTIGYANVRYIMSIDFQTLYQGYAKPPWEILDFYRCSFGPSILILAAAGYVAGIVKFRRQRSAIVLTALLGAMSALFWVFGARQVNPQSNLHFMPVVLAGLALAFGSVWHSTGAWRRPALATLAGFMLLNFFAALGNVHAVECRPGFRDWLSGHQSPAKRSDYAAVASLVDYLRCAATPQDIILVFASSGAMNEDLLRHADSQLHACDGPRLSVFASPQIDSRDYYPLECLLFAKYVVVAHPFQRQVYIPVDQQKVCRVGYDALVEKWEIAGDFEPMPKTFLLDGGVTAQVYRRIRPTSAATAVRTLQRMEAYVGRRPGTQVSWMFLNGERFGHSLYPEIEYFSDLGFRSKEPRAPAMVCIDHVPRRGELQGRLDLPDPRCPGARVILSALAPDGTVTSLGAATLRRTESQWDFRLPFSIGDADHLLLTLATLDDRDVSREGVAVWVKGLKAVAAGEGPGK